jgi:hypothetical protein
MLSAVSPIIRKAILDFPQQLVNNLAQPDYSSKSSLRIIWLEHGFVFGPRLLANDQFSPLLAF